MREIIKNGFTLIELLVVVLIIGILTGLITSAFMKSKNNAQKKQRAIEVRAIQAAIENYRYEYQRWPCDAEGSYSNGVNGNNKIIFSCLLNNQSGYNERKIRYLNMSDYRTDNNTNLIDYTGKPFAITISYTNDSVSVK